MLRPYMSCTAARSPHGYNSTQTPAEWTSVVFFLVLPDPAPETACWCIAVLAHRNSVPVQLIARGARAIRSAVYGEQTSGNPGGIAGKERTMR